MTLNISVISEHGIWQSSDHRLSAPGTIPNDTAQKQVIIRGSDGTALVSYTHGSMHLIPGGHLAHWIRRVLRGSTGTVDSFLIELRKEATAELPHDSLIGFAIALRAGGQRWGVEITNLQEDGSVGPSFVTRGTHHEDTVVGVSGYRKALQDADIEQLHQIAMRTTKYPRAMAGALAALNYRVSMRASSAETISPTCTVIYSPPENEPFETFHLDWSRPAHRRETGGEQVPMVLFGVDLTEIVNVMLRPEFRPGTAIDTYLFSKQVEEAARRSVLKQHLDTHPAN